jgi:folate-binding protein YgfZ
MSVVLPRSFLRATGPDAAAHLHSMLSNEIEGLPAGAGVYALLLTPKARVISDMEVLNAGEELVIACPAETRDDVVTALLRARFRKKVEIEPADYALVWGEAPDPVAAMQTPAGPVSLVREARSAGEQAEWEVARVEAGMPRFGNEFGVDSMPAEAGLLDRAVSFTKGCYPGQEPIARLHYRGHANRGLRGLRLANGAAAGAAVVAGEREVGTVTSVVDSPRFGRIGLAVLRREVRDGERVSAGGSPATVTPLPF